MMSTETMIQWSKLRRQFKQCFIRGTHGISRTLVTKHTVVLRLLIIVLRGGKSWYLRI